MIVIEQVVYIVVVIQCLSGVVPLAEMGRIYIQELNTLSLAKTFIFCIVLVSVFCILSMQFSQVASITDFWWTVCPTFVFY